MVYQSYTSQRDFDRPSAGVKKIARCGGRKRNGQRVKYDVERIDYREGRARSISYCWWAVARREDYDTGATNVASQLPSGKLVFGIDLFADR